MMPDSIDPFTTSERPMTSVAGPQKTITFSFGRNWKSFSRFASESAIQRAEEDVRLWLGPQGVAGKSVIDIGCGSGIHSLVLRRMGAASLLSIDADPASVQSTNRFHGRAGNPSNWRVLQGSILDEALLNSLGRFDVVYSWGVLHHTGQMWNAIENASRLAAPDGQLWISIYAKGPNYPNHLRVKQKFNKASWLYKKAYVAYYLLARWRAETCAGHRLKDWFWYERGMNAYHDALDWFGGLPYEVATVDEVKARLEPHGWTLERLREAPEGQCHVFLFRRSQR